MKLRVRSILLVCSQVALSVCAAIGTPDDARAQTYPSRTIRIIVSAPPAGGADIVGRTIGLKLADAWGQPVVIDNRPGGGGNVGTDLAAKSSPDGHTILVITPSHTTNPYLHRSLPFDPIRDFSPVTQMTSGSYVAVVAPSSSVHTVKDLIALAHSRKGGISYASSGNGQAGHLGMELLKTLGGFEGAHVPYKGSAPALIDVMAGQVDTSLATMPGGLPHVRSGKLRAVAVTSVKRAALLPDVPTVAESGFPGYEVSGWYGLLVRAGTPREIVAKLHDEVVRILALPDIRDRMASEGAEAVGSTPEQFAAYIRAEMRKWSEVIRKSGARLD